ncbi:hypothetical protein GCM10029992_40470 [Glycomyces albus]
MQAAVLGKPVEHSLSPAIHNAGYKAAALSGWTYSKHECDESGLARFVDGLDQTWAGLSLTMPLKEIALAVAEETTPVAEAIGAANTLVLRDGRRLADNTDAPGMVDALAEIGLEQAKEVAVLGAGGTARGALGAASQLGAEVVTVYARRREAVIELEEPAERLGVELRSAGWDEAVVAGRADLIVSTVPKGVTDTLRLDWRPGTVLFDVLYDPGPRRWPPRPRTRARAWSTDWHCCWPRRSGSGPSSPGSTRPRSRRCVRRSTRRRGDAEPTGGRPRALLNREKTSGSASELSLTVSACRFSRLDPSASASAAPTRSRGSTVRSNTWCSANTRTSPPWTRSTSRSTRASRWRTSAPTAPGSPPPSNC